MALLGWSPGKGKEIFDISQMARDFKPEKLSKAPAIFDPAKLRWVARQHMRAIAPERLAEMVMPYLKKQMIGSGALDTKDTERLCAVMKLVREEAGSLEEAASLCRPFFEERRNEEELISLADRPGVRELLALALVGAKRCGFTSREEAECFLGELQKTTPLRGKEFYMPLRLALTGEESGMELRDILVLMGRDRVIARIEKALA
ncbi:MAG: hypothetical protein NTU88_08905, partial [Armatimonadetes bacterium]|nr:hypothetical protein [Armatimonadota bacterium]